MSSRRHERVQRHLPALVDDELPRWRRRLVERHLRRCEDCAQAAERQQRVAAGLEEVGAAAERPLDDVQPPPELLERLLEDTRDPGIRQRVAVPARGAVSGARPGLTVTLALVVLGLVGLAVWVGWRLGRSRGEASTR